jgi:hypothetical protein
LLSTELAFYYSGTVTKTQHTLFLTLWRTNIWSVFVLLICWSLMLDERQCGSPVFDTNKCRNFFIIMVSYQHLEVLGYLREVISWTLYRRTYQWNHPYTWGYFDFS